MAESKVMKCNSKNCQSNYQDTIYGKGNRLFNPTDGGYRCTICGKPTKWCESVERYERFCCDDCKEKYRQKN